MNNKVLVKRKHSQFFLFLFLVWSVNQRFVSPKVCFLRAFLIEFTLRIYLSRLFFFSGWFSPWFIRRDDSFIHPSIHAFVVVVRYASHRSSQATRMRFDSAPTVAVRTKAPTATRPIWLHLHVAARLVLFALTFTVWFGLIRRICIHFSLFAIVRSAWWFWAFPRSSPSSPFHPYYSRLFHVLLSTDEWKPISIHWTLSIVKKVN